MAGELVERLRGRQPMPSAKPLDTKPPFRPDAPQAILLASSSTTDLPRRANSSAVVSPASPAPITQASASTRPVRGGRSAPRSTVASYQVRSE